MENENNEIIDSIIDTDTTENESDIEVNEVEELRKKIQTLEAQKEHFRKKAERAADQPQTSSPEVSISVRDEVALAKADLDSDVEEQLVQYAKIKKISVRDALKSTFAKNIIAEANENKRVAEASNTGSARRGSSKLSDDALLANARANATLPDSEDDIKRLVQARLKSR